MKDAIYCGLLAAIMLAVLIRDYYHARLERGFARAIDFTVTTEER